MTWFLISLAIGVVIGVVFTACASDRPSCRPNASRASTGCQWPRRC